jgi:acyl carrier protein
MDLKKEIKEKLIEQLNLVDLTPEDIVDDSPLFGEGLGLDSIDALEIIVLLDNDYGIRLTNPEQGKEVFYSINTLVSFIEKNQ